MDFPVRREACVLAGEMESGVSREAKNILKNAQNPRARVHSTPAPTVTPASSPHPSVCRHSMMEAHSQWM